LGYQGAAHYIQEARGHSDVELEQLWWEHAIEPYWAEWAAGQFNEIRTREQMKQPIVDLDNLAVEVNLLADSQIETLIERAYKYITDCLPSPLPSRTVCVYPLDPQNTYVKDKMNGVLGDGIGDNILLKINPLAADWQSWVPLVIAHEYHHAVWGYNYFAVLGSRRMDLLTGLLIDGQADSFAKMLYPDLHPIWIEALTPAQEAEQWQKAQEYLASGDGAVYSRFMFGDDTTNTPANTGYTIGYHIVQAYLRAHPQKGVIDLMNVDADTILAESGYNPI
jgi:uncharacterized protein YjaZ